MFTFTCFLFGLCFFFFLFTFFLNTNLLFYLHFLHKNILRCCNKLCHKTWLVVQGLLYTQYNYKNTIITIIKCKEKYKTDSKMENKTYQFRIHLSREACLRRTRNWTYLRMLIGSLDITGSLGFIFSFHPKDRPVKSNHGNDSITQREHEYL